MTKSQNEMLGGKRRDHIFTVVLIGAANLAFDHYTTGVGSISLGKWQHKSEIMIWLAEGKRVLRAMTV